MTDQYVIDTESRLTEFQREFSGLSPFLNQDIIDMWKTLNGEIEMLIGQYESKCGDLETAQEIISEAGIDEIVTSNGDEQ